MLAGVVGFEPTLGLLSLVPESKSGALAAWLHPNIYKQAYTRPHLRFPTEPQLI